MQRVRIDIGQSEYEMLYDKPYCEISKYVEDNLISDSVKWGYGYYGCDMKPTYDKDTGEYYIYIRIGSSCD